MYRPLQNKLREIRFFKQKSQTLLAWETGIPQSRISLIEKGLTIIRPDEITKIAESLNTEPREVFPNDV